ncbi:hypothetical protein BEP19_10330 [Ammoniphilus oxalaticus]|uniref:Disulfide oxidoreductase n=1 Tax=Ammoniphilus oxalaticus TaxID=66863 RepID=A0A419SFU0_9BACL|nr:disulfide oxidoreductase [Ammoniphilus oxalaticus]RKD22647.1 hypothetical protein BEP19_10330 [Ammoniphilus oxalaticus]
MIKEYSLYFAWLVAVIATGGSLYFSEFMYYAPCELCWYQRIFMYPLVFLLGIAAYKQDRAIIPYAKVLTVIGMSISIFHYLEQKIPAMQKLSICSSGVPCSGQYINWFGFITIPFLALMGFALIFWLLSATKGKS